MTSRRTSPPPRPARALGLVAAALAWAASVAGIGCDRVTRERADRRTMDVVEVVGSPEPLAEADRRPRATDPAPSPAPEGVDAGAVGTTTTTSAELEPAGGRDGGAEPRGSDRYSIIEAPDLAVNLGWKLADGGAVVSDR